MKMADHRFNLTETPIIADQILRNYKRDKSYFEHFSPKFDHEFLVKFEEKVDTLAHLTPLQVLKNEIAKKDENIKIIINHFRPLLNITEALLQRVATAQNLPVANSGLNELRESLNRGNTGEIQKNCRNMISKLELRIDELIDKGFILRILNDFHLLTVKLKNAESELADVTHQYNMNTDKYLMIDNQLEDFVEPIIESIHVVFGENDADKKEEYAIAKLMTHAQFMRSESH